MAGRPGAGHARPCHPAPCTAMLHAPCVRRAARPPRLHQHPAQQHPPAGAAPAWRFRRPPWRWPRRGRTKSSWRPQSSPGAPCHHPPATAGGGAAQARAASARRAPSGGQQPARGASAAGAGTNPRRHPTKRSTRLQHVFNALLHHAPLGPQLLYVLRRAGRRGRGDGLTQCCIAPREGGPAAPPTTARVCRLRCCSPVPRPHLEREHVLGLVEDAQQRLPLLLRRHALALGPAGGGGGGGGSAFERRGCRRLLAGCALVGGAAWRASTLPAVGEGSLCRARALEHPARSPRLPHGRLAPQASGAYMAAQCAAGSGRREGECGRGRAGLVAAEVCVSCLWRV